jgi:hypothetical protein
MGRHSMTIRLSRHARGRMKLYGIAQEDVETTINHPDQTMIDGDNSIAIRGFAGKYSGYPLKVVYSSQKGEALVVTAYPLKKKREEP